MTNSSPDMAISVKHECVAMHELTVKEYDINM